MANSRDIFALGGKRQPAGRDPPAPPRRAPTDYDDLSWERLDHDNASASNVAGQFGPQGGGVQFNLQGGGNTFSLGGGVSSSGPPANITQQWGDRGDGDAATPAGPPPTGAYAYATPLEQAHPPQHVHHHLGDRTQEWQRPSTSGASGTPRRRCRNCIGCKGRGATRHNSSSSEMSPGLYKSSRRTSLSSRAACIAPSCIHP
jgi:hypothetical protein